MINLPLYIKNTINMILLEGRIVNFRDCTKLQSFFFWRLRKRKLHLLVHSPNACQQLRLGASWTQVPRVAGRHLTTWTITTAVQGLHWPEAAVRSTVSWNASITPPSKQMPTRVEYCFYISTISMKKNVYDVSETSYPLVFHLRIVEAFVTTAPMPKLPPICSHYIY